MKKKIIALMLILCLALPACSKQVPEGTPSPTQGQEQQGNEDSAQTGSAAADVTASPAATEALTPAPTEEPDDFEGKTLNFDTEKTHQTIDGFGAAYTWYAERLLKAENSEEGFDALFNDAKLTILRFKNEYEYNIEDKADNAVTMANYYKNARETAAQYGEKVQVLMCCWSPPAKLKSDNSIDVGTGTLKKDASGNYCYDEYAAWWVESLKYYMSYGIKIDYVSIQNEVDYGPDDYEGCLFAKNETDKQASYSKAFLAVYRAMKEAFGDDAPKMLGPETMNCAPAVLKSYMKEALEEEPDSMYGYAFHLYQGGTSDSETMTVSPSSYFENFSSMTTVLGDTPKWQTEFYIGHGIQTAQLINNALTLGNLNAYIYWSGVWADSVNFTFESPDLIEVSPSGVWRTSANYWALRHFSEYIRPGYLRIDAISGDSKIKCSAYASADKTKIAVVLINPNEEEFSYRLRGNDYTITDSKVIQSVFTEECESTDNLYLDLGSLGKGETLTLPAMSVTTIDITGYFGDTAITPAPVEVITYDDDVITEVIAAPLPENDVTVIDTSFTQDSDVNGFSGFGSSKTAFSADAGSDGNGCLKVSGRVQDWNGLMLSSGYFEHYGYMLYVSYDCMMETEGQTISCTSSFQHNGADQYPDGENRRVVCTGMEAGKWYHAEGYMTMFADMDPGTFRIYWESAGNTDDFYLDNVKVQILYTQPAGNFEE